MVTGGHDEDADAVKVYLVKRNSIWRPGSNSAPEGDIVAEDMVERPTESGVDSAGVEHQIIKGVGYTLRGCPERAARDFFCLTCCPLFVIMKMYSVGDFLNLK